jgi:hypothetical protein
MKTSGTLCILIELLKQHENPWPSNHFKDPISIQEAKMRPDWPEWKKAINDEYNAST